MCFRTVSLQYGVLVHFLSTMRLSTVSLQCVFSTFSLQHAFKYSFSLVCVLVQFLSRLLLVSCKVSLQYVF